ncbi:MAG TPA: GtrA family protein [Bacilli bacterium]|nr:GtrA family protein [Bacilli bacterium]
MLKKFIKNRENQAEIIRFVIVGIICTLIDFAVYSLFFYVVYTGTHSTVVAKTAGQAAGIIANYILSVFFVYKNVADEKDSRSITGFILFATLSLLGFGLNLGITKLGELILDLRVNFFWNAFVFGFATLIVLIFNYITRKLFIFKPKKENDEINETENDEE